MAQNTLEKTFAGTDTGTSNSLFIHPGKFTMTIKFTGTGTVVVERSFDNSTFYTVNNQYTGTAESHTASISKNLEEVENGVWYRFNCTAHGGSGNIYCRLGQKD
jgi:hypothetical protein